MLTREHYSDPETLYEAMLQIRCYEERLAALQAEGGLPGTCTSVGQEAAAVGVVSALGADELILTNHRSAGHLLARGADPGRLMAEVMGKAGGYCRGKSGSLHISAKELGVVLTSTIVGGELSLAPGVAFAQKQLRRPGAVVCFFGDGAACEGIFHESLNLASVWSLPLLYVCENNQWQAFVHRSETMRAERIGDWRHTYAMEGASVDGNDVEAVRAATLHALACIRDSGRPYLLELVTYRLRGHFEPDDQAYVDPQELARWRLRDPLALAQARLLDSGAASAGALAAMAAGVELRIDAALAFAQDSPYPDSSELTTDVYA